MRVLLWFGFVLMAAAQWYVPLSLVTRSEKSLSEGEVFRFKTEPVDPTDPFRGKYVALYFEADELFLRDTVTKYERGQSVYASLRIDSAGYAVVDTLYLEDPADESLRGFTTSVDFTYIYPDGRQNIGLTFPFQRLYLEESKADDAERVYWQSQNLSDSMTTYAVVRIKDNHPVLVDVMINDRSIVEIVEQLNKEK